VWDLGRHKTGMEEIGSTIEKWALLGPYVADIILYT
jgi:hypothetical protein